jgi:predicted MPP superfamily phosphohydrolase
MMTALLTALLILALAANCYYFWRRARAEADGLALTGQTIACPRLPAAFEGFRILHLSDLHLRGPSPRHWRVIALAEQAAPDIVVITGDLLGSRSGLMEAKGLLRTLARMWPTYVVLGNADLRVARAEALAETWSALGARVLVNQGERLERDGGHLWIAGVNDAHTGRDFLEAAAAGAWDEEFVIALSHSPDLVQRPEARRADLVLAGHTHGGQIVLPYLGALYARTRLGRAHASGLHKIEGIPVFISRGVGSTRLRLRLNSPPEVVLVTLVGVGDR